MSTTLASPSPMPRKKPQPKDATRGRIDLRADPEFVARVQSQADRLGMSLSAYLRMAVTERLERDEASQPKGGPK